MFAPLLVLVIIVFTMGSTWSPFPGETGAFLWVVMLGAALGCVLALLPILYNGGSREHYAAQRWFGFVLLLAVLAYQYATRFLGVYIPWLAWLYPASGQLMFAESCLTGYCLVGALRARR